MFPYDVFSIIPLDKPDVLQNPPTEQPHRKVNLSAQNVC